jgi:putative peptidoglycan lipid II flippase
MTGPAAVGSPNPVWTLGRSSMVVGVQLVAGAAGVFVLHALAAATFGAGATLDAYYLGAAIPMVLVSTLSAGLVFIVAPLVRNARDRSDRDQQAMPVASLIVVGGFCLAVAVAGSVLAERIIGLIGSGLDVSVQPTAARVLAIQIWSPLLVAVSVWLSAHLVAIERPALASAGPVAGNAVAVLAFALTMGRGEVAWVAWSVLAGAAVQLAFVVAALRVSKVLVSRSAATRRATRRAMALVLPWLAAASLYKCHMLIDRVIGSWDDPGAVTSLALGLTLVTAAASFLTRGIGLALSPRLGGEAEAARRYVWHGVRTALILLAPAIAIMILLRVEMISVLFGHGQFSASDVATTAATLVPYAVVLAAFGIGNVITTTFYALGDTRTPAVVGVAGLAIHLTVSLALWPALGYLAAGWGFAAMSVTSLGVLVFLLGRRIGPLAGRQELIRALRPVVVAVAYLPLLVGLRTVLGASFGDDKISTVLVATLATLPYLAAYVGTLMLGRTTLLGARQ